MRNWTSDLAPPPGRRPSNRRGEIRRGFYLGCRIQKPSSRRLVGDRSLDVSPQGMLVLSDERLDLGSEVLVSFRATDLGIWFDARATIARLIEGRRPGDRGRAFGLQFRDVSAISRLILRGHLRRIPPVLPKRPRPLEPAPKVATMPLPLPIAAYAQVASVAAATAGDPDYARIVMDIFEGRA